MHRGPAIRRRRRPTWLHTAEFITRRRRASTRITLSTKKGVWLTRKRNCLSPTGTSSTSVLATAVALRGASSISAISVDQRDLAEDVLLFERIQAPVAQADLNLTALDDIEFVGRITFLEDGLARLESTWRDSAPSPED
jgi:hypothetical protein